MGQGDQALRGQVELMDWDRRRGNPAPNERTAGWGAMIREIGFRRHKPGMPFGPIVAPGHPRGPNVSPICHIRSGKRLEKAHGRGSDAVRH
jgi:hypothetical protein